MRLMLPLLASLALPGENDWNQFRGPGGAGVAIDSAAYPDALAEPAWATPVSHGLSSPSFAGGRLFVTGAVERTLETYCLDRETGEVHWKRSVEARELERMHEINGAAASTPVTDGEVVVSYFGAFGLVAYDLEGEELWRRELEPARNTFGSAASPILAEGLLVYVRDTNDLSFLEALDVASGEVIWRTERGGFGSGWSTPTLRHTEDAYEILVYGVSWLTAYDLADGSERWSLPGLTDEPIVTPVLEGELVFLTSYNMKTNPEVIGLPPFAELLSRYDEDGSGELTREEAAKNDSVLSRADADGEGDHPLSIFFRMLDEDESGSISAEEYDELIAWVDGFAHVNGLLAIDPTGAEGKPAIVWQEKRGVPECPSPIVYDGRVYMVKNGGLLSCLKARGGEVQYRERIAGGPYYASPVAGDGKLYFASARGEISVVRAGGEFELVSSQDLGERIMATPALVGGTVYVRTEARVLAFQ